MPVQSFAHDLLHCFRGECQCNLLLMIHYIVSGAKGPCSIFLLTYCIVSGEMPVQYFAFDLLHCFRGKCRCVFLLMIYFNVLRENARAVFGF